jgi:hypothetical protein
MELDELAAFQSIVSLEFTRFRAILAAHWWILTHLGLIRRKRKEIQSMRKVDDKQILKTMFPKSIVFQYFFFKKRKYSELTS